MRRGPLDHRPGHEGSECPVWPTGVRSPNLKSRDLTTEPEKDRLTEVVVEYLESAIDTQCANVRVRLYTLAL
ncbi:hypothetical protein NDU88_007482 [Pleurodeles waltl]|uniref:Uncharacterized protein n=1 Tax=Pleurodeles waltl TaxID=8319 RepID=A0AAV7SSI8_PLEWA|nr:hypothetical protein NDU88_007482 [Pleurodeles waltl]